MEGQKDFWMGLMAQSFFYKTVRFPASVDNTLRDLLNSSYPTKAEFINS